MKNIEDSIVLYCYKTVGVFSWTAAVSPNVDTFMYLKFHFMFSNIIVVSWGI